MTALTQAIHRHLPREARQIPPKAKRAGVVTLFALAAVAILVGFVPGCGPQILVTSLYLSGAMPLSAQLGNAIANDGDALFPAIAAAPRAALAASLYSALPAWVAAYGWYWLVEASE